ncbi:MAG: transposase, partial [Anaerolineae bacterium]
MNQPTSTREHINRLIEFRQAIYAEGFLARRDALFEVLDALLATGAPASFAMLSQSERFQRRWPSLYAAVEDGRIASAWLRRFLIQQVYQASSDVNGGTVTIGYPYSLLEWCAEAHSSWSLPLDVRRISSAETAQAVGAEQIRHLAQARCDCTEALDIVPADGKYGNAGFLRQVRGLRVGVITRLRRDRVLYQAPPQSTTRRRGRPRK